MYVLGSKLTGGKLELSCSGVDHVLGLKAEIMGVVLWISTESASDFNLFGLGFRTERRWCLIVS